MARVTFCDSRGLAALVYLWRRLYDRQGRLVLAGLTQPVAKTLQLTGLHQLLPSFATLAQALSAGCTPTPDSPDTP